MNHILVAGATGYLGHYLVAEFKKRGWEVSALVRDAARARQKGLSADHFIEAEATEPASLEGVMTGIDTVISALGKTRQKDDLTYQDVDYQANCNLLAAAEKAGVSRFAYIHVVNAKALVDHSALAKAKQSFVDTLTASPIASTVIAPTGYFSDMGDLFNMAASGRVMLFGDGSVKVNPIDGRDLATASADAVETGTNAIDVGGPDTFTFDDIAKLAFSELERKPRILHLPFFLADAALGLTKQLTAEKTWGPFEFFLAASRTDMEAPAFGTHHLADHFRALAAEKKR